MSGLLQEELATAVCNLPPATICRLRDFGIPESVIFAAPLMLGVTNVQTFLSGFYEPSEDGDPAAIVVEDSLRSVPAGSRRKP